MQRYAIIIIFAFAFAFAAGCTPVVEDFESLDTREQARLHNPSTQPEPPPKPSHFDARQFVKNAMAATIVIGATVYLATIAVGFCVLYIIYHSGPFWR